MVGGRGVQIAGLQATPQEFLVALGPEGRAHHMACSVGEVRVAVDRVVDDQVAGQNFAVHALAAGAGAGHSFGCLDARHMHHVDWHTQHVGNRDGAVGGLAFDARRP